MRHFDVSDVSKFLTVTELSTRKILDVEHLLETHNPESVLFLLKSILKEENRKLRKLIRSDISDYRVDILIAKNFRLKMAINTLRNRINHNNRMHGREAA